MCNTAGFTGGCGHQRHQQGLGGHHQQQQQGTDGGRGVSMLTHTPPCRYEEQAATGMCLVWSRKLCVSSMDMGVRQLLAAGRDPIPSSSCPAPDI